MFFIMGVFCTAVSNINEGDIVKFKRGVTYVPDGKHVPNWLIDGWSHVVTKTTQESEPKIVGGVRHVFLGKKLRDGEEGYLSGIMAWVMVDALEKIPQEKKEG